MVIAQAFAKADEILAVDATAPSETESVKILSPSTPPDASSRRTPKPGPVIESGAKGRIDKGATRDLTSGGKGVVPRTSTMNAAEAVTATVLRGNRSSRGATGGWMTAKISTWAHARAAQVLRVEAVAVALRWVAGAKNIQVG